MARVSLNTKYKQIRAALQSRILDGTYSVGEQIPSQNDLMRDYGVSYATVIHALHGLVQEGYLVRIHGKGTFVAERKNATSTGKSKLIGISVSSIDLRRGNFGAQLVSAMESAAREHGYRVIVTCSDDDQEIERANLENLYNHGVDGIALWYIGGEANIDWLQRFQHERVPFVFFDRYLPSFPTDYVVADNRTGALEATRQLIEMGYHRIAFLSCNEIVSSVNDRFSGYQSALSEAGIAQDPSLVQVADAHYLHDASIRLARQLLDRETGPLAIFAVNGTVLRAVCQAMAERGQMTNTDIALCTVDDPGIRLPAHVPFVEVVQPQEEMGREVIEILAKKIAGDESIYEVALPPVVQVHYQGELTVNGKKIDGPELVTSR